MLVGAARTTAWATRPPSSSSVSALLSLSRPSRTAVLLPTPRTLSTIPTSFTPGGPDPPSLYPTQPEGPPRRSATAEFYRALVPAMLHCLALGSIVYYALELGWMWLKREKEGLELSEKVRRLEGELDVARRRGLVPVVVEEGKKEGKSWWKLW